MIESSEKTMHRDVSNFHLCLPSDFCVGFQDLCHPLGYQRNFLCQQVAWPQKLDHELSCIMVRSTKQVAGRFKGQEVAATPSDRQPSALGPLLAAMY